MGSCPVHLTSQYTKSPQNIYEGVITNALLSCSKEVVTRRGKQAVMREFSACIVVAR